MAALSCNGRSTISKAGASPVRPRIARHSTNLADRRRYPGGNRNGDPESHPSADRRGALVAGKITVVDRLGALTPRPARSILGRLAGTRDLTGCPSWDRGKSPAMGSTAVTENTTAWQPDAEIPPVRAPSTGANGSES